MCKSTKRQSSWMHQPMHFRPGCQNRHHLSQPPDLCLCPLPLWNLKNGTCHCLSGSHRSRAHPCPSTEGGGGKVRLLPRADFGIFSRFAEWSNHRGPAMWMLIGHCRWSLTTNRSMMTCDHWTESSNEHLWLFNVFNLLNWTRLSRFWSQITRLPFLGVGKEW